MMRRSNSSPSANRLALAAALALTTGSAHAALILEEQFNYGPGELDINGQAGGTGFDGPWAVTGWSRPYLTGITNFSSGTNNTTNADGGLEFPGHPSSGSGLSRFGTAGQRVATRLVAQPSLTTDGTTIWFSVLAAAPNGNKFGTLIFGTDPLMAQQSAPPFPNGNLSVASGQGFGVGFRTDNAGVAGGGSGSPNAVAFIDSDSATVDVGSFIPNFTAGNSHHDASLIVGRINWNPNGTADELYLFNMASAGMPEPDVADAIASLSADFDQSLFDTISLWDTGSSIFDEIRFGNTFADVTPVPEPSGMALVGLAGLALILRRRR